MVAQFSSNVLRHELVLVDVAKVYSLAGRGQGDVRIMSRTASVSQPITVEYKDRWTLIVRHENGCFINGNRVHQGIYPLKGVVTWITFPNGSDEVALVIPEVKGDENPTFVKTFANIFDAELNFDEEVEFEDIKGFLVMMDIRDSTKWVQALGNKVYSQIVAKTLRGLTQLTRVESYGVRKLGTPGDSVFLYVANLEGLKRVLHYFHETLQEVNKKLSGFGLGPMAWGIGVHAGTFQYDPELETVIDQEAHLVARIEAATKSFQVSPLTVAASPQAVEGLKIKAVHTTNNLKGFEGEYTLYQIEV